MENEVKEPAPIYNRIKPDEYLAMERAADIKHEYFDGHITAMSGASVNHLQITTNLIVGIGSFLEDKECTIFTSDMRVGTPGRDGYFYPDASIICGELLLEDEKFDTLLNPSVLFEILSPSTRKADMFYKFTWYKQIPSIMEYIMIDSVRRDVEVAIRLQDGIWETKNFSEKEFLQIRSIGYQIALDHIYKGTRFK